MAGEPPGCMRQKLERVQATCRPELPHAHRGGTWSREVRIGTEEDANGEKSGWEIEVQAGVGDGEVEMRAVRQGGGREERMRLRSARASRGREDLWRIASCTERKRSQERAMGVVRSSRASFFLRFLEL